VKSSYNFWNKNSTLKKVYKIFWNLLSKCPSQCCRLINSYLKESKLKLRFLRLFAKIKFVGSNLSIGNAALLDFWRKQKCGRVSFICQHINDSFLKITETRLKENGESTNVSGNFIGTMHTGPADPIFGQKQVFFKENDQTEYGVLFIIH